MLFLANLVNRDEGYPPVVMLCGPSGVGKTTLARIFAAAANCNEREKANPCTVCADCTMVQDGNHPAVVELDAALHSGADDMRRIRDQAYLQAPGNLQVFIIDEVHSASAQAWNVLLKLLEEPPAGVCFLLLTSEPHKVPTKIRTRAMRLDCGKVAPSYIRDRITEVAAEHDYALQPEIAEQIIEQCEGSVRDAIMLLEQASIVGDEALTVAAGTDNSLGIIHAALRREHAMGLSLLNESYEKTSDFKGIMSMWGLAMEKILFQKHDLPLYASPRSLALLKELSKGMSETQWAAGMETLSEWSPRVVSKAHLSFVWSQFVRALNGPTTAMPLEVKPVEKKETTPQDIDEALGEFA